jgi:DNA-binding NtrC family response regulator
MSKTGLSVLLVDDEPRILAVEESCLRTGGITDVVKCSEPHRVDSILAERAIGVMVLDLWMPEIGGKEILARIVETHPEIPVIVMTGDNAIESAVECMRAGAFDYLVKPPDPSRLLTVVRRALELRELRRDYAMLSERVQTEGLRHPEAFSDIVARSPIMWKVFQYVETVAPSGRPVLIMGETGTGKELIARALHTLSGRPGKFVAVNVGGVDDTVFSDTLFGHLRGAFTGAETHRAGLIEQAADGTLFLDEIGDLTESSQVKLLRLLESGEYYPLGSDMPRRSQARIVVATHRELGALQETGQFRRDLYFRLRTHQVRIPPLRERKQDLGVLVEHFLEKASVAMEKKKPSAPPEILTLLETYSFPGNVRELESLLFNAVSMHTSKKLSLEPVREHLQGESRVARAMPEAGPLVSFSETLPTLDEACDLLIDEALRRAKGNQTIAAHLLGMSRTTLSKRMRRTEGGE